MVDFKAKLAAARAKTALDKQLAKAKKDSAPNMNTVWNPRKKKEDEPPPPDLSELVSHADNLTLRKLINRRAEVGKDIAKLNRQKDILTEEIKPYCKIYDLGKFMVDGNKSNYYKTVRSTINKELLLAHGVSPEIIAACTVETTSWNFKVTPPGGIDEQADD